MSKLFGMEPKQEKEEALQRIRERIEGQDKMDTEAALHLELLVQTDAKLDRFNARLDRFYTELNQWNHALRDVQHPVRQASSSANNQAPGFLAALVLLAAGLFGGSFYSAWRYLKTPLLQPGFDQAAAPPLLPDQPSPSVIADAAPPRPSAAVQSSEPKAEKEPVKMAETKKNLAETGEGQSPVTVKMVEEPPLAVNPQFATAEKPPLKVKAVGVPAPVAADSQQQGAPETVPASGKAAAAPAIIQSSHGRIQM